MLDYKITKKHYPRTNNASVLEFVFERDPNLFLRKNKILIRGFNYTLLYRQLPGYMMKTYILIYRGTLGHFRFLFVF